MFRLVENARSQGSAKNNLLLIVLVVALLAGGAGFFGGMKYQESKMPSRTDFQARMGMRQDTPGVHSPAGPEMIRGEIIGQDEESITVKLADESSKIILITKNSAINKTEEGGVDDLSEGVEVMIFGQENSDGSITAQSIQIGTGFFRRPE